MTIAKSITKTLDISVEDVRIDLTATIRSYDLTDTQFVFEIKSSNGMTVNLTSSTAMYIVEYVHNLQTYAIQGDIDIIGTNTLSFNLPEDLKGYSGTVLIGIYVKLTDGTKIDIKDIAVRIEPSIMDKDIDFTAKTYFKDFESIKAEVILAGENAKNQINAVLPTIQSQVSELDRQIKALPQIPDLFVAYADDLSGTGFSKNDTTKLYKGFGVKNSNLPADYRWERNVNGLSVGGENLFLDAAFRNKILKTDEPINKVPGVWVAYNNGGNYKFVEYNDQINYLQLTSKTNMNYGMAQFYDTDTLQKGKEYCVRVFTMCEDVDYTININLIKKNSSGSFEWYYKNLLTDNVKASVDFTERKVKFTIPADDDGIMYGISIINRGSASTEGHIIKFVKPKLEEGNLFTDFSVSTLYDNVLGSHPINSVLTTLSSENPSTTLGGAWTQFGTESKFGSTIYYWKRTN